MQSTLTTLGLFALAALPVQARTFVVDNQNSRASDKGAATVAQPLRTINAAAQLAQAGDEIVVGAGVYRETIVPARGGEAGKPIVYRAAEKGRVVVKATEVWKPNWERVAGRASLYRADLPMAMLREFNPFALKATTFDGDISQGQLFHEGKPLRETPDKQEYSADAWGWRALEEGTVAELHAPEGAPSTLEISTRAALFRPYLRGLGYITIRDFTFEGSANGEVTIDYYKTGNTPQAGAVSTRAGHHWTLEGNTIRFAKTTGFDCGSEGLWRAIDDQPSPDVVGYHLIRGNVISDNGQAGILGSRQMGSRFERNVIARNNLDHFDRTEEAGMKCHLFFNCVIEGNLFLDNENEGLWLDNVWYGTRVSHNAFIGNGMTGMFVELGNGPLLIEKNIFGWSRLDFRNQKYPRGDGFYAHDSSGFTLRDNIMVNNPNFGVYLRTVTDRQLKIFAPNPTVFVYPKEGREQVSTSNITMQGNLIAGNHSALISLRSDKDVSGNVSDNNLLGAPRLFQMNSFHNSKDPMPKALVDMPLEWQKWRELTGHDKASREVEVRAELIRGARPVIRLEVDRPLPAAIMEIAKTEGLPYELQITVTNAR